MNRTTSVKYYHAIALVQLTFVSTPDCNGKPAKQLAVESGTMMDRRTNINVQRVICIDAEFGERKYAVTQLPPMIILENDKKWVITLLQIIVLSINILIKMEK